MSDETIQLRIHRSARREWEEFLGRLPGRRLDDVRMLVTEYLGMYAKDILAQIARSRSERTRWQCPFAQDYDLIVETRLTTGGREITISGVEPSIPSRARP